MTGRYFCTNCKARHIGDCANAEVPDDELSKERVCKDCRRTKEGDKRRQQPGEESDGDGTPARTKGKKKRKTGGAASKAPSGFQKLPQASGSDDDIKIACRWTYAQPNKCLPRSLWLNLPLHVVTGHFVFMGFS